MKPKSIARLSFPIAAAIAALLVAALSLRSHAAPVTWGPVQPLTGSTDIVSTGVTNLAGANFGITTGTTTTVTAAETGGSVDVEFKSLNSGQSATLSNLITVAAASTWGNWGTAGGISPITGNFGVVLDSNLGIEGANGTSANITLSGLTIGTVYQVQFFADSTGSNSQTISGSGAMNSSSGQYVTGTFTADATEQVLTVTQGADFAVANALTIGVGGTVADTTAPTVSTFSPADNATDVSISTNLSVTFSEPIAIGTGDITLKNLTDNTQSTIAITDGSQVSVAGAVLTINPTADLTAAKNYAIQIAPTAIKDLASTPNFFAGIANDTTWNFATPSPAAVVTWVGATWTDVTDNQAIQVLPTYTTVEGVNFNGSTTLINNGPGGIGGTDVSFTGIGQNASGSAAGITVANSNMDFAVINGNISNVSSTVGTPQNWGDVLDRVVGDYGSGAEITLSGLTSGSQYYVQFFSSNPDGNGQDDMKLSSGGVDSPLFGTHTAGQTRYTIATFTAVGPTQAFSYSGGEPHFCALVIGSKPPGSPDTTPPAWTLNWPQADPLSTTSLTVRAKTNEAGTAYYVVLPDGATAPTSAQVKAGQNSGGSAVSASGSLALTANTEATTTVGSLSPGTAYDVYFVAEDAEPNLQVSPVKVDTSTLTPDLTAPTWTATWPQAGQLSPTSITVRAQTNETGTVYYVVLADGATAPSAAQVKAGQDSGGSPVSASGSLALTANTEATGPVTGLTADTSYDVYFVAEDAVPNLQATPVLVNVTLVTPADVTWGSVTTPVDDSSVVTAGVTGLFGANFAPATGPIIANGVTFTAVTNNSSAVIGGGITVATSGMAFTVNNGANSNVTGNFGTIMDTHTGAAGGNTGTITLSGLVDGTQYQIQFFASINDTNAIQTQTITGGANTSAAFGTHGIGSGKTLIGTFTASGTTQVLTIQCSDPGREPVANALTIGVVSVGNTFADWIGGYDVGLLTGFGDDADGDGLDNGLENFLGTAPNVGNAGLTAGALSGNTFTFTHPQNATPASDVSAPVYTWSTDLVSWNASGASSGGITVDLAPDTDTPSAGTTTVTATVTGTLPSKLFVRLEVSSLLE